MSGLKKSVLGQRMRDLRTEPGQSLQDLIALGADDLDRLEMWLRLIRDRAGGLRAVSQEFEVIAKWCEAALAGEKR